jgi:hypothetical protein
LETLVGGLLERTMRGGVKAPLACLWQANRFYLVLAAVLQLE